MPHFFPNKLRMLGKEYVIQYKLYKRNLRFIFIAASSWGYCNNHLIPEIEDCQENYYKVDDLCVR